MDRRSLMRGAAAALLTVPAAPTGAARLTPVDVVRSPALLRHRPDWPVPDEPNQMLYLQRSLNRNVLVFAVRYDAEGRLSLPRAVSVFWRRFEEDGARRPLRPLEQLLVGQVTLHPLPRPNRYRVEIRTLRQLNLVLIHEAPFRSRLTGLIGGQWVRPVYVFADVIDGLIPRVTDLWMNGVMGDGRGIAEHYEVAGGAVRG